MVMASMREKRFIQIILWSLIVAFVATIFVAWGMKNTLGETRKDPNVVAEVGESQVTYTELNQALQPYNEQMAANGDDSQSADNKLIRKRVIDGLVDQAILRETGRTMKLTVPDEELQAALQREPAFQDENRRFNKDRYLQALQGANLRPEEFEESLRQSILAQKIRAVLQDSVLYTPPEVARFADRISRDLKAQYVPFDAVKMGQSLKSTDADLNRYFEDHRSRWDKPERAKLRHILLTVGDKSTPEEVESAKKTLEGYRKQILEKKSTFADLAKRFSQDTGSGKKGGELGWITRGMTVPDFEDAAFKLAKGEMSQPVKTQFGYHLIQLEDYEKAKRATLASVRPEVEKAWRQDETEKRIQVLQSRLTNRLNSGDALAKAAGDLKLDLHETGWFNRTKGIAEWKDSKSAAESLSVLHVGEWRGPLSLGKNQQVVFEISQDRENPPTKEQLAKMQSTVQALLMDEKQDEWMKAFMKEQRKALKIKIYDTDGQS